MKHYEDIVSFLGTSENVYKIDGYTVVFIGCDRWTFSDDHEIAMIIEALERYL